jgi:hypothetical protein
VQAAHLNLFKAIALPHPSFFVPEDAENVSCPVALLPSSGEDKDVMNGFWERIQKKPFAAQCVREDFVSPVSVATWCVLMMNQVGYESRLCFGESELSR